MHANHDPTEFHALIINPTFLFLKKSKGISSAQSTIFPSVFDESRLGLAMAKGVPRARAAAGVPSADQRVTDQDRH